MKTALVTTTINVPEVLRLYRARDARMQVAIPVSDPIKFFIALDQNSDFKGIAAAEMSDPMTSWLTPDWQKKWACSEPIGWKNIQRRNAATLEALEWGADVIVMVDDDNIPIGDYFLEVRRALLNLHNGVRATSGTDWFDVGALLDPVAPHRGFPHTKKSEPIFDAVVGAKVGVAAGICLGDPDVSAVDRISRAPIVHRVSELLRAGIVTDPSDTLTVYNSQNTSFIRELAPAMFMIPGIGRYDDLFASLITQRVMKDRGYHVHFGLPFVWQQRNSHNLIKDLQMEIWGMEHIVAFAKWLHDLELGGPTVLDDVRGIFTLMSALDWMPAQSREAGLAWIEDCARVMG